MSGNTIVRTKNFIEFIELNEFTNYVLSLLEMHLHDDKKIKNYVKKSLNEKYVYIPIVLNDYPNVVYFPWTEKYTYIRRKRLEHIMNLRNGLDTQWEIFDKMDKVDNRWIFREIMIGIANDYLNSLTFDNYKNSIVKINNVNVIEFKFNKSKIMRKHKTFNKLNAHLVKTRQMIRDVYTGRYDMHIFSDDLNEMDDIPYNSSNTEQIINETFGCYQDKDIDVYGTMLEMQICHLKNELQNNKSIKV